ncbi:MAG: hypothetical protein MSA56_05860 [Clostridium sp.]|nr:hypothetical protein [Clostridium sp.]
MSSTTTKKSTTKKNNNTITVSKEEYENLLNQMKEMQTMFAQMTSQQQPVQNITQYIGENNKDVIVTSLTVGQLNLSTEGYGQGEIYTFEHIGEEQSIPLEDLKKIIKNNKSFVEGGNFFINDDDVVKSQKLTNIYKKLLSYDEMLDLFNKDRSVFEKVFANMTANQKETLKRIIFEKLNENEKSVDMNIVQVINDNLGIDIMDDFRNQKKLSEILKNDN